MTLPLKWHGGDRAMWRGRIATVEYVAEDGVLISYRTIAARWPGHPVVKCAIVSLSDLTLVH